MNQPGAQLMRWDSRPRTSLKVCEKRNPALPTAQEAVINGRLKRSGPRHAATALLPSWLRCQLPHRSVAVAATVERGAVKIAVHVPDQTSFGNCPVAGGEKTVQQSQHAHL